MSLQRRPLAARAFALLARVSNALQAWPNRMTPPAFRLLQIGSAFWQSRVLDVAARLDLATVLADAPLSAADLAAKVGADPQALTRLLRMLAAMGVFDEVAPGTYRNNQLSDALRTDRPNNVRAMVLMHNSPEMSRPWFEQLEQGIRSGEVPFRLQHGQDLYDYMDSHAGFDALFAQAMDQVEALTGDSFATGFNWQAFDRIIDVGGSKGAKSMAILKRHPHLQAVVVDRAQTIQNAPSFWRERQGTGVADCLARMRFEVGDVRASVPVATSSREAYLLSAVLHGFDDDTCVQALRTVAAAASEKGACIVLLEMVMPDHQADLTAASFDMQMFMGTRGTSEPAANGHGCSRAPICAWSRSSTWHRSGKCWCCDRRWPGDWLCAQATLTASGGGLAWLAPLRAAGLAPTSCEFAQTAPVGRSILSPHA